MGRGKGGGRTDEGLAVVDFERALAVADEEGEVEEVLDGLPEVVWVHDEPKEVHPLFLLCQYALQLCERPYQRTRRRGGEREDVRWRHSWWSRSRSA